MTVVTVGALVLAGVAAGLAGSVAGLASLVSYPALLAAGLPPVTANVTNSVALVGSSIGSALGSRPELRGQSARLRGLAVVAALGGATGAGLLLLTPGAAFERLVPWLIAGASLVLLVGPRVPAAGHAHRTGDARGAALGTYLVAVYGGYFGAAAGVMVLALLLALTGESLARANAAKNVLLGLANAVAAVLFLVLGPVVWSAALPLGGGFLVGGRLGPLVVRRVPAGPLRTLIAVAGLLVALRLGVDAYG